MLKCLMAAVALLGLVSGTALAAPSDYAVEARGKPKGTGSDLIVKVQDKRSGKYITDAKVWYLTSKQGAKGGPVESISKPLPSDGKGNYRVRVKLRKTSGDEVENFLVSVPGESEPITARVTVKYSDK